MRFQGVFYGREREVRRISAAPHIHEWLHNPRGLFEVRAAARALFTSFVSGDEIYLGDDIKRVEGRDPNYPFADEVWSMRVNFKPSYRFVGAFAMPDWFIVLSMAARDEIRPNGFVKQIDKVATKWAELMPGLPKFSAPHPDQYVTYNAVPNDSRE